jgi:hypothetical protein
MITESTFANFRSPVYTRITRSAETYKATQDYTIAKLVRLVELYKDTVNDQQQSRLIRDDIDQGLRRYHQYCIQQRHGAHYIQQDAGERTVFEHLVPASTVRDLLLDEVITPEQACNMPTCILSVENDRLLREAGWASRTPDIFNFWKRYQYCFDTTELFETHDGKAIDPATWTLADHFEYFEHARAV